MDYLHREVPLEADEVVEVILDNAANVQLMNAEDFEQYRNGKPYHYVGGHYKKSPARITAPHPGRWHLVIDLGGGPGHVSASLRVLPNLSISNLE